MVIGLNPSLVGIQLGAVWQGGGRKVVATSTTSDFALKIEKIFFA